MITLRAPPDGVPIDPIIVPYPTENKVSRTAFLPSVCFVSIFFMTDNPMGSMIAIIVCSPKKDDKIAEVISNFQNINIAHTSGSIGLEIFKSNFTNCGVFYPLQTFNKEVDITFSEIPLCIEANNPEFEKELLKIGESLSNSVVKMNSEQRKQLHIAAVFACNFSNHMFSIADDILQKSNVDFNLLHPLIRQTIKKIEKHSPKSVQTGPAKRNDKKIIESHLQSLEKNQQELYKLITNSIIKNND